MDLQVLFEDENVQVVNKPVGMTLGDGFLGLPEEVSGIEIIAKNTLAMAELERFKEQGTLKVTYLAWVCANIPDESGQLEHLNWKKVHQVYQNTLVRIAPETFDLGIIRQEFKYIGHPIIGDQKYNPQTNYTGGLLMHSSTLQLPIPFTDEVREIGAPLPKAFPRNLRKDFQ
ncbi:MAG: hypothetical protein LBT37_03125 [Lactobacillaceae bacterium]|jgi:23S rRNA pseudouridine1911/1915/1917 synthase|nr:hypothetical protein [Lactobacillaceae bacterium]